MDMLGEVIIDVNKIPNMFLQKNKLSAALSKCIIDGDVDEITQVIKSEINKASTDVNKLKNSPKALWNNYLKRLYRILTAARKKAHFTNNVSDYEVLNSREDEWKKQ